MVSSMVIARLNIFVGVSVFGIIAMGLCADLINKHGNLPFAALTVAAGTLTLLTLPSMMFISSIRHPTTSSIAFEVGWLSLLGVLFLASGAVTTQANSGLSNCRIYSKLYGGGVHTAFCNEIKAIQAFTYLAWILCWGYAASLGVATMNLVNRGYSGVWKQSVQRTDFSAPAQNTGVPPVAGLVSPQMQPQMVQPAFTPQLVSQPGSQPGSPALEQPSQVGTHQPVQQV